MKVTVVVDTNIIAKEDYVNELRADGSGDVSRPLTVSCLLYTSPSPRD